MTLKKLLLSIAFGIFTLGVSADSSFLPALEFEYVYRDNEFIFGTSEHGIDSESYIEFLTSEENTLGEKAALIEALAAYFEFYGREEESYFEQYSSYF